MDNLLSAILNLIWNNIGDSFHSRLVAIVIVVFIIAYKIYRTIRADKREDNLQEEQDAFRQSLLKQIVELREENDKLHKNNNVTTQRNLYLEGQIRTTKLNLEVFRRILYTEGVDRRIMMLYDKITSSEVVTTRNTLRRIENAIILETASSVDQPSE